MEDESSEVRSAHHENNRGFDLHDEDSDSSTGNLVISEEMLVPIVELQEDNETNWKFKQKRKRNVKRSESLKLPESGKPLEASSSKTSSPRCSNCSTEKTSMWRRDKSGNLVCNACGLYIKLYGINRPLNMRKDTIRVRNRKSAKSSPTEKRSHKLNKTFAASAEKDASLTQSASKETPLQITPLKPGTNNLSSPNPSLPNWAVSMLPLPPPLKRRPEPRQSDLRPETENSPEEVRVQPNLPDLSQFYKEVLANFQRQQQTFVDPLLIAAALSQRLPFQPELLQHRAESDDERVDKNEEIEIESPIEGSAHESPIEMTDNCSDVSVETPRKRHVNRGSRIDPHTRCTNCSTQKTSIWRRNSAGQPICNACGLYAKLHGVDRPVNLRSDVIRKRSRKMNAKSKLNRINETSSVDNDRDDA